MCAVPPTKSPSRSTRRSWYRCCVRRRRCRMSCSRRRSRCGGAPMPPNGILAHSGAHPVVPTLRTYPTYQPCVPTLRTYSMVRHRCSARWRIALVRVRSCSTPSRPRASCTYSLTRTRRNRGQPRRSSRRNRAAARTPGCGLNPRLRLDPQAAARAPDWRLCLRPRLTSLPPFERCVCVWADVP